MALAQDKGQIPGSAGPPHPYDKRWHVHVDGKTYGPYTGHQIRHMVEQHQVGSSDFVYPEGESGSAWQQIANDPILGVLFKNAEAHRVPLVPRIEPPRQFRGWLFTIPVLVIVGWIVWPYYALYDLAVAVRDGDVSALEARVAWDSVRQGLRGDLNAMLLQKINTDAATDKSSGAAVGTGLAVVLGPVVVDRMVDSYVTPQVVAAARRAAKNDDASSDAEKVPKGFNEAIQAARHFRVDQIKYAFFSGGPLSFRVEFTPDHDPPFQHPTGLRFQWDGTWRLTRLLLPLDVLNTLPTTAKNDAAASKLVTNQSAPEPALPAPEAVPPPPASKKPQIEASWSIEESKSPIDDSPQVTGMLFAEGSSALEMMGLTLRCKEKKTEALFAKQFAFFGTNVPLKVLVRINDGKPIETQWQPSSNGQAVFAPAAVQFIRGLPDDGKLFIRVTGFDGALVDGSFSLGKVSEIRNKLASACRWPDTQLAVPVPAPRAVSPSAQGPK